jgi:DNA-binding MarR family transcriptional regulator
MRHLEAAGGSDGFSPTLRALGLGKQTLTSHNRVLAAAGYITRERESYGLARTTLTLTEAGHEALTRYREVMLESLKARNNVGGTADLAAISAA